MPSTRQTRAPTAPAHHRRRQTRTCSRANPVIPAVGRGHGKRAIVRVDPDHGLASPR
jgi:hypothetical protein